MEGSEQQVALIETVDLEENDNMCVTPISCSGSNRKNPISVEQYDEDRDLNRAIMASLSNQTNPISVEQYTEERDLNRAIMASLSNQTNPISVEQYTEERDLHRAIMASLLPTPDFIIDLSQLEYDDDDVQVVDIKPFISPFVPERGQSSNSKTDPPPPFLCEICVEPKPVDESFNINGCSHSYCTECMIKYVASKLQDNVTTIRCPVSNCNGLLEPEYCREILPLEVFERWGNALCESVLLGSEKFYCPFKDCSALLINDGDGDGDGVAGGAMITQSECPNCNRLFCAQCKTSWHSGIDCAEFQKLNKDEREREDIMMMELAKNKNWKRCPKCRFYVEKSAGCMYMKCRCGFAFCYNCGAPSTTDSHLCSKCKH